MLRAPLPGLRRLGVVIAAAAVLVSGCGHPTDAPRPAAEPTTSGASSAVDQRSTTVGIADSDLLGLPQPQVVDAVGRMKQLGVTTVRLLVPWAAIQPSPDVYDWSMVDKTVNAVSSQHMSILATLNSPPGWAVAPGQPAIAGRPASPAAFGLFAGKVAEHFRGKISAYEIWNEPNWSAFYAPAPDPAGYADLLKAAYPAIKAAAPSALVVAAGLGSVVDHAMITMDPVKFVSGMYTAGARNFFDALAFHPYQYSMKFSESWHPDAPLNQLSEIRRVMLANGDGEKKIWATEYGEPSSEVGEKAQAEYLDDMLGTWRSLSYAGPVYVYTMRDRNSDSREPDDTLGIFRSDGTPKAAQSVVTSYLGMPDVGEGPIPAPR
ncbi:cellulase family glycosylhydrolase [Mycobacterium hodleri]|uniref:cellulase family glycosylhydrolase n=1 Tax=Mycolicibacterium hodleri TaxID=49897 RepID=UPI0021F2EA88|nr:cellulase family glycosylhydrolase [Mycolicibacterium hodleri]MCV7133098.1 cellulase family glycosylhydrolase [Mycolicibacterium hodleri]